MAKVCFFNLSAEARNKIFEHAKLVIEHAKIACSIPVLNVEVNMENASAVVSSHEFQLKRCLARFG